MAKRAVAVTKPKEQYQNAVITLSDGTKGVFTGAVLVRDGDSRGVAKIQFTEPKELPAGCQLAVMDEGETKPGRTGT